MKFSFEEIQARAQKLFPNSIMENKLTTVLHDIYRIGLIGNYFGDGTTRWEYKGQYNLLIDDNWKMIIHPSLRIELSVNSRKDKYINKFNSSQLTYKSNEGKDYIAKIEQIHYRYIKVSFEMDGYKQEGYISMNNLGYNVVEEGQINSLFNVGDILTVKIIDYNPKYSNWCMYVVNTNDHD